MKGSEKRKEAKDETKEHPKKSGLKRLGGRQQEPAMVCKRPSR